MQTQNDFTLAFGKFRGMKFSSTPDWYQQWLPKQPWFSFPSIDALQNAQRAFSVASKGVRNWDGYSRKGAASYDAMYAAERAMEDAIYCDCGKMKAKGERTCWSCAD